MFTDSEVLDESGTYYPYLFMGYYSTHVRVAEGFYEKLGDKHWVLHEGLVVHQIENDVFALNPADLERSLIRHYQKREISTSTSSWHIAYSGKVHSKRRGANMLELILTEVVAGLGMAGVTHLAKTAHSRMSEKSPLVVKETSLAPYLPRREALAKPIAASDIESLSFSDFLEEYIYDGKSSPIDCAEISIRLQNVSKSRLSISGLGVNRHFLDEVPAASFLSIPQERLVPGECYKFAVDLNADLPTVSSRYRRTYMEAPPVIALETDERFPDRNHKTRWEL